MGRELTLLLLPLALLAAPAQAEDGAAAEEVKIEVVQLPEVCSPKSKKGDLLNAHYDGFLASDGSKFYCRWAPGHRGGGREGRPWLSGGRGAACPPREQRVPLTVARCGPVLSPPCPRSGVSGICWDPVRAQLAVHVNISNFPPSQPLFLLN